MAIDQRDWWLERVLRRTGYREKASFRINLGRHERAASWRRLWLVALAVAGVMCALGALAKYLVRGHF